MQREVFLQRSRSKNLDYGFRLQQCWYAYGNLQLLKTAAIMLSTKGLPQSFVYGTRQEGFSQVFDASQLLQKYPAMKLSIPTKLTWMVENPGTQLMTGSFQPIEGDWTAEAYGGT